MTDEYERLRAESMRNIEFRASSGLAAVMTEDQRKRRTAKLDESRPLQGRFRDYLTEIDVTNPREVLPPDYQAHLDKPVPRGAIDIAAFKEWCTQLDKDMESGNPPF